MAALASWIALGPGTPCRVAAAAIVTRGPYLQSGTPTSIVIRWRTDLATDSRVEYGSTAGNLGGASVEDTVTTEHEVRLTQLAPGRKYFYAIGTSTERLAGDTSYFFRTAPPPGTAQPVRVWAIGDAGTADFRQRAVRDAYYGFAATDYTDVWLMLGDNAYCCGFDPQYQSAVFDMYPTLLRRTVLWPTIGNHDTDQSPNPSPTIPYYNIFTLPVGGEAGGLASGTEDYYSFDYANVHFVCLDSMTSDRLSSGPMLNWLRNDLAATSQEWIVAFWHHPPYSRGSHNSDIEVELVQMRENAVPVLEEYGVDLVLCGHSHSYERSFLINGHYGTTGTLMPAMILDSGSGREFDTGAYQKPIGGLGANQGAIYAVAGSSGQGPSGGPLNHPAMFVSTNVLGSVVLDINGPRLDAYFLRETGVIDDYFTLIKGPAQPGLQPALRIQRATNAVVLSWPTSQPSFILQETTNVAASGTWRTTPANPTVVGRQKVLPVATSDEKKFFRLHSEP